MGEGWPDVGVKIKNLPTLGTHRSGRNIFPRVSLFRRLPARDKGEELYTPLV